MKSTRRHARQRKLGKSVSYTVEALEQRCLLTSVLSAAFDYEHAPNAFVVGFDQDMRGQIDANSFTLDNVTLDRQILGLNVAFSGDGQTATITAPTRSDSTSGVAGVLPDGYYRLATSALDVPEIGDWHYDDFYLTGDADHSGVVGFDDYNRIDNGFNLGLSGWINGDFDYSGTVNLNDYAMIDQAYGGVLQAPPTGPDAVSVSYLTSVGVVVNWNAASVNGETGWVVRRSLDGVDFTQWFDHADGDDTGSYTDTDATLPDGSRVYYRVRAYGNGMDTAYTPKASVITPLSAPTGLAAVAQSGSAIGLTWMDNFDQ